MASLSLPAPHRRSAPRWVAAALLLGAGTASAQLGESVNRAPLPDAQRASLNRLVARAQASTEPTSVSWETPQGLRITTHANAQGTVYALTWDGPLQPDVRSLLGTYFGAYLRAARAASAPPGLHRAEVSGDGVEVRSMGRMRSFSGAAWVPALAPAGFDPSTLTP